jgi:ABC-type branched-subunit amino acid transport system substrate-binding protein
MRHASNIQPPTTNSGNIMAAPLRVGILNDMSAGPPGPADIESWLRLAADELIENGRLDRAVEFVHGWGLGLPAGTAAAVEHAFRDLAGRDVLLIIGPAIGDNALVATPLAETYGIPTINWAGSERARSKNMFHLQVGSHEDESILLARHMHALGARRVAVAYDRSPIGRRHLQFLQAEAEIIGLTIAATAAVAPLAEDAGAEIAQLLGAAPDGIIYLGLGIAARAVALSLTEAGWTGPRAMNTAGMRGYDPAFAQAIDGWIYVDMHDDGNRTLNDLCARRGLAPRARLAAAKGYDLGRLMAEGLARAPERTREGVRDGLEQIKWLPAAEGFEGTQLGFGIYDRGALHGRYLVLRQWRGGDSVQCAEQ